MTASLVANVVISGVLTGLVYGLMALGLSVIFGVVRVVNFAHGEMMAVGMYAAVWLFTTAHLDPIVAIIPVGVAFFVFGYALQATLINPMITRPEHSQFILLVAVATIISNLLLMQFGPNAMSVQTSYQLDSYEIGPLLFDKTRVFSGIAAIVCSAALFAFFRFTHTGKAIRACADNHLGARVVGLDVKRLYALTFGVGSACLAAAACMTILVVDVSPVVGPAYTLLAFVIVIVGGLGSMGGALLGGVLIGVSEAVAGLLFNPAMKSMFSFALLILVLVFLPQGLLGRKS